MNLDRFYNIFGYIMGQFVTFDKRVYTFILWYPCWWAPECPEPNFPCNSNSNSNSNSPPNSLIYNSISVGRNYFKFDTKTRCMVL